MATLAKQRGVELYRLVHQRAPGHARAIWSHGRVLYQTATVRRWRVQNDGPVGQSHRQLRDAVARGWRIVAIYQGHGQRAELFNGRDVCRRCGHRMARHYRGSCRYPDLMGGGGSCWCGRT